MNRVLRILVREYLENVRTKAFLIGVFLTPVLMGLTFLIPALSEKQAVPRRTVAVADVDGALGEDVAAALAESRMPSTDGGGTEARYDVERIPLEGDTPAARERDLEARAPALAERVKEGALFGYLVVRPSALRRPGRAAPEEARAPSEFRTGSLTDPTALEGFRRTLQRVTNRRIARERAVPDDAATLLTTEVPFAARSILAEGKAGATATALAPFVFVFLLFFSIVGISQALITSTLEEKGNRVIEVLLSSVSPYQLMAGKILGICAVGLTLMGLWAVGGVAALAAQGMLGLVTASNLLLFLVYYLLGFLLIASLMVAVGSACNTLKEAQNLLSPLMVLLSLPLMLWIVIMKDPNGSLATGLSFVPIFTPFLMMMRAASFPPPPTSEIVASIALLALCTWLSIRVAARVFRVGILLYGKPPSIREIFRWMRAKG